MSKKAIRSILGLFPENSIDGMENFRKKHIHDLGREIPLHVTLLDDFLLPQDIDGNVKTDLNEIARGTPSFSFFARPISCFPTTRVLYLSPTPLAPFEQLRKNIVEKFSPPGVRQEIPPIFHMTIALGYSRQREGEIINEFFASFGENPLGFRPGSLRVYILTGGRWEEHLSFEVE